MSKVEKHPTDEGKYQSTFDDYGHGEGNGKSRNAVYKHAKKLEINTEYGKSSSTKKTDFVKEQEEPTAQNQEIPIWDSETNAQNQDFSDWGEVEWDSEISDSTQDTIPKPIAALGMGDSPMIDVQATGQMVRMGFMGLDRMLTHWGRGVMNDKEWTLTRSRSDYDALEISTVNVMQHYGITVPVSPLMVWGMTVGSAYVPPINHIRKNADPNRRRSRLLSRLWPFKKKKKNTQNQEEVTHYDEPNP